MIRVLADESVEKLIVHAFRKHGLDTTWVTEQCPGARDSRVLKLAVKQGRLLVTRDRDFGALVYQKQMPHHGILYYRLKRLVDQNEASTMASLVLEHGANLLDHFSVFNGRTLRIRANP